MAKSGFFRRSNVKQCILCLFCGSFVFIALFNKLSSNFPAKAWKEGISSEISDQQQINMNLRGLNVLINKPKSCQENTKFLIAVMSSPIDFAKRKIIRRTWGVPSEIADAEARLLFFVGESTSKKVQARIEAESATHNDIIQFGFMDEYNKLSMKTINMMKWFVQFCGHSPWFVKTDVDAFWNIYLLKLILSSRDQQKTLEEYQKLWREMVHKGKIRGFNEPNSLKDRKRFHILNAIKNGESLQKALKSAKSGTSNISQLVQQRIESTSKLNGKDSDLNLNRSNLNLDLDQSAVVSGQTRGIICAKAKGLRVCRKPEYDRCEERYVVTKDEYSAELYPPHCHGFGYALKNEVAKKVLNEDQKRTAQGLPRFRMEDVYITGILLNNTKINFLDISEETVSGPWRWSPQAVLLIHNPQRHLGPGSARFLWENMKHLHMVAAADG